MHSLMMALLLSVLALTAFAAPKNNSIIKISSDAFPFAMEQLNETDPGSVQPRTNYEHVTCGEWGSVDGTEIQAGIRYLSHVKGEPHLDAHTCERVSCSWNSGIYWCNDADKHRHLPSYNNIAQGATKIWYTCQPLKTTGTLWHVDDWRAIIAKPSNTGDDKNC